MGGISFGGSMKRALKNIPGKVANNVKVPAQPASPQAAPAAPATQAAPVQQERRESTAIQRGTQEAGLVGKRKGRAKPGATRLNSSSSLLGD